jgi:hypothetical protein
MESVYPAVTRAIVSALMAVELWLLITIPAAADPLITFVTIGAIPGTDRRLTLDETYQFIGVAFVLVLCTVFHEQLLLPFRRAVRLHPGHVNGYVPVRYVLAVQSPTVRRKRVEWRKVLELDRILVFAVRRGIRKTARRLKAARLDMHIVVSAWRARLAG